MIRNEADILPLFLDHCAGLFDSVFLLDHLSTDGSEELLAEMPRRDPRFQIFRLEFSGRHQSVMATVFTRRAFAAGADAVFQLDADEFLDVPGRFALEAMVEDLQRRDTAGALSWRPCIPDGFGSDRPFANQKLWVSNRPHDVRKVVIPRSVFERTQGTGGFVVSHGGHLAISVPDKQAIPMVDAGTLLHLPLRSRAQFIRKAVVGALSEIGAGNVSMQERNFQARQMLEMVASGHLSDTDLAGFSMRYGQKRAVRVPLGSLDDLARHGFTMRERALFAPAGPAVGRAESKEQASGPETSWRVISQALLSLAMEPADDVDFVIERNVVRARRRA